MLEAREGYYFTENYTGDFIKEITAKDVTPSKNIHLVRMDTPTKPNYETIFIAAGKGIKAALPYRI